MADRVIVVPGGPEFFRSAVVPSQMVDDLQTVGKIPYERIDAVAAKLELEEGVLNSSRLEGLLRPVLGEERPVAATLAALQNLQPADVPQTLRSLHQWRTMSKKNAEQLSDEVLKSLERNLPRLIRKYPALVSYHKAAWLFSAIGNNATSLEVICDARPVFNDPRDSIQGMVPLTILKIGYERQDGETRAVEVHLTGQMLNDLVEKAQKAQQKLKVLRESIETWIPNGLATVSG